MRITFKLFATLTECLPPSLDGHERRGNEIAVDAPDGSTVQEVIDRFHLPRPLVHLVLVNGVFVPPGERTRRALADGDTLAIWPPIAGG